MKLKMFSLLLTALFIAVVLIPNMSFSQDKTYDVLKGDCLWKIAKKEYQNGKLWPEIWMANKDGVVNKDILDREKYKTIKNPNLIFPNQVLRVPKAIKLNELQMKDAYKEAKKYWRKMHPYKPKVKKEGTEENKEIQKEEPKK